MQLDRTALCYTYSKTIRCFKPNMQKENKTIKTIIAKRKLNQRNMANRMSIISYPLLLTEYCLTVNLICSIQWRVSTWKGFYIGIFKGWKFKVFHFHTGREFTSISFSNLEYENSDDKNAYIYAISTICSKKLVRRWISHGFKISVWNILHIICCAISNDPFFQQIRHTHKKDKVFAQNHSNTISITRGITVLNLFHLGRYNLSFTVWNFVLNSMQLSPF